MIDLLNRQAIIAAIKDKAALSAVCSAPVSGVFMLFGNVTDLPRQVETLRENNKRIFIHVDLVDGLQPDEEGIRFIAQTVRPDGVISTKPKIIKQAHGYGLATVLRIFMIDASAFETGLAGIRSCKPDAVEIMPGLVYDVFGQLGAQTKIPLIAGGMIKTKAQADMALAGGAGAVSTSRQELWRL